MRGCTGLQCPLRKLSSSRHGCPVLSWCSQEKAACLALGLRKSTCRRPCPALWGRHEWRELSGQGPHRCRCFPQPPLALLTPGWKLTAAKLRDQCSAGGCGRWFLFPLQERQVCWPWYMQGPTVAQFCKQAPCQHLKKITQSLNKYS